MFDVTDKVNKLKKALIEKTKSVDFSSYEKKIMDTKNDVLDRIDEVTNKFKTEVNIYVKKPVKIAAAEYTYPLSDEIRDWMGNTAIERSNDVPPYLEIKTLEGTMIAHEGDMIIQGVAGEFYPCKPEIFKKTYERA